MENLDELNEKYVKKLLPNIIWMFVCLFTGVVGNTLVLLVYRLRLKTELNERYFIPILALLDLLASSVSGLHGILNYMFYMNYPSEVMCKIFNFGSFFTASASAHTLLLIAVQRYRKICVPFGKQMDLFWKRVSFAILIVVSLSYSFPVIFSAGIVHQENNQTVSLCAIDSGDYLLFYQIYFSGVFFIMVSNVVAVTVLYSRIGWFIYRRGRKSVRTESPVSLKLTKLHKIEESTNSLKSLDSEKQCTDISQVSSQENHVEPVETGINFRSTNVLNISEVTDRTLGAPDNSVDQAEKTKLNQYTGEDPKDRRITKEKEMTKWNRTKVNFNKLFGAIIIFYLISFVPTLVLFVATSFGYMYHLDLNVFVFINRMYLINNIVNPFIYGYFDFCFRHSVKSLFRCRQ